MNQVIYSPPTLKTLATRVQRETQARVFDAAKRADQPVAAWLRMAIMEKLERDGARP